MVFPVCVGEPLLPWRRCTGWGRRPVRRDAPDRTPSLLVELVELVERLGLVGPVEPGYEIVASVLRTLALISAGIGA